MTPELEVIIGLEVHAQVSTKTKMFCGCSTESFGKDPNTTVCPVCMGHPGTLPVVNGLAVAKAMRASLAIGCTVQPQCHFDRKHYFYPDLPSGYQISQYDYPLSKHGGVAYTLLNSGGSVAAEKTCRILRLHLENDAGKLTHVGKKTWCDYNRAGTPLMEIVTEPDLRSAEEAVAFAQELRRILIAVDASDADMFKGMMRFDASISLREKGTEKLNPRSEIKNLNSFKSLEKALQYEERRLRELWQETGKPLPGNITVGWQDDLEQTRMLRDKENADDYRYFPEPDIPPFVLTPKQISDVQSTLPKLPAQLRADYAAIGLDGKQIQQLVDEAKLRAIFDAVMAKTKDAKRSVGIVLTQLIGFLNAANKTLDDAPSAEAICLLVDAIDAGTISGSAGKAVLEKMVQTGKAASVIIAEEGLQQVSDDGAIAELARKALEANPEAVASFKAGKQAAFGSLVGWVMKESKGQANPQKVNEALQKQLAE